MRFMYDALAQDALSTHKFTAKERDAESGLDNFGARYDSSALGRFMSADPDNAGTSAGDPQSWNAYSYALNNPLNATDPSGRETVFVVCDTTGRCATLSKEQFESFQKNSQGLLFYSENDRSLIAVKNDDGSYSLVGGYYSYDNGAENAVADLNGISKEFALNYAFGAVEAGIARLFGWGGRAFKISAQSRSAEAARLAAAAAAREAFIAGGGIIDTIVQTSAGPVRVYARVEMEGSRAIIKELAVYAADNRAAIDVGYTEMREGFKAVLNDLKGAGFTEYRMEPQYRSGRAAKPIIQRLTSGTLSGKL